MKRINKIAFMVLLTGLVSCGSATKENKESDSVQPVAVEETVDSAAVRDTATEQVAEAPEIDHTANIELIRTVYKKFVLSLGGGDGQANPKKYFTRHALKKLAADYEYDCDTGDCYAFWMLRTSYQDGPGSDKIVSIEPAEEGWYVVTYKDMGYDGVTRVKVVDGKIDDYKSVKG